ncbi:MAG TPA: hypothetical protein VGN57_19525 [Pirellulaceae bacterium]|jgi:hypothetical protein|nr:hypothetical protein [Pirellulaceae bacterium]
MPSGSEGKKRASAQHPETRNAAFCHGIAMTADEREIWLVDQKHIGLHVFEVPRLPGRAPEWKTFIKFRRGQPQNPGLVGQPGWIMVTIDSKYFYPETL